MNKRAATGSSSSNRLLVRGILAQTALVVRDAQRGNWLGATLASSQRRELLGRLEKQCLPQDDATVLALRQAIAESDEALSLIGTPPMVPGRGLMLR